MLIYRVGRRVLIAVFLALLVLFLVAFLHPDWQRLRWFTNVYGLEAAAGAVIGFLLIWNQKARPRDWLHAPLWLCVGLSFWAVGQVLWVVYYDQKTLYRSPGPWDAAFLLTEVCWVATMLRLFSILRREWLKALTPLGFIISFAATSTVGVVLFLHGAREPKSWALLSVGVDIGYLLLTTFGFLLAVALLQGDNQELPATVLRCLRRISIAAFVELISTAAFVVTLRLPNGDPWEYKDGGWVDLLFLIAILLWCLAVLEHPIGEDAFKYSFASLRNDRMRDFQDALRAAELARAERLSAGPHGEMCLSPEYAQWIAANIPECWTIAKCGDQVVGTCVLLPINEERRRRFPREKLTEEKLFLEIRGDTEPGKEVTKPLSWDWVYVAEAEVAREHHHRGIVYQCLWHSIADIRAEHPGVKVLYRPRNAADRHSVDRLRTDFPGTTVTYP